MPKNITIDTPKVGRLHNAQYRDAIGQCQMSRSMIGGELLNTHSERPSLGVSPVATCYLK